MMKCLVSAPIFAGIAFGLFASLGSLQALSQEPLPGGSDTPDAVLAPINVPSRVISSVDEARLVKLTGNTHPEARPKNDLGLVDPGKLLQRLVLVLKRSPEQEKALHDFNERQYDPKSPDFHRWLHAEEFGKLYGPSDADIAAVTNWLQNHGFSIDLVSTGHLTVQFTGTVAQVQNAFHVEMHRYFAEGKEHFANDRDPQIPEALLPVITGIASLNDFLPRHSAQSGSLVRRDLKTGKYTPWNPGQSNGQPKPEETTGEPGYYVAPDQNQGVKPDYGWVDANTHYQREDLSPYDVATIYNILPLWNESTPINGTGVTVAIVGVSDVSLSDFNTFRSSFGLPASTFTTLHSGTDPGFTSSRGENTEDTEMVSATAPGAKIVLVADPDTASGLMTAATYIIDNEIAPIMTMSYLECELALGTAGNAMWSQTFQQATTEGITPFVCAGDSGSSICTLQSGTPPYGDQYGLAVNGMASNPYVTAVGGTDLQWPFTEGTHPVSTYWNATTDAHGATAKGYMPEMSWNATCTSPLLLNFYTTFTNSEALCNAAISALPAIVDIASGSGGVSACTTNSFTGTGTLDPTSCSGGYAKPSWQTGVTGIPADGKRDVPDTSLFGSYGFGSGNNTGIPGSALLVCISSFSPDNSCDYSDPTQIIYQENGGTSAASPMTAGIMAMILQKVGTKQGLANPVLYKIAAKENYSACNSNTVAAGNSCIFYDTTVGSNAMDCYTGGPDCVTNTSGDAAGIISGYNATTGYDLTTGLGTINVTNLVNAWAAELGAPAVTLSPTSIPFGKWTQGTQSSAVVVTLKNTGTAVLNITSITFTGTNPANFVKTASTCTTTLAASASCTISVAFKPTAAQAYAANLSIADNATGTPQLVTLTGTGLAPGTTVTLTPTSISFGKWSVGSQSTAVPVTLKNTGTATLSITTISFTGTNPTNFLKTAATTCASTLAAGASCIIDVAFHPTSAAAFSADLSIADNATGTPQLVTLAGTGVVPLAPVVSLSATTLTFPNTVTGTTSDAQIVTVKNTGTAAASITSIALGGTNPTGFELLNGCGTSLAAAATCPLYIAFKPASAAAFTATISVTDNASGSPQKVTLTGTGTAVPVIKFSAATLAFPTTTHATTSESLAVTVTNSGTSSVEIASITITGTNPTDFTQINTCATSLAAGASCTVYVAFTPAAVASYTAKLTFADSGALSPQTVTLTGTGK